VATIVMERGFDPPLDESAFRDMLSGLEDCVRIYRAHWQESLLAVDGSALTCCFVAPDAESVRMLSRGDASSRKVVWAGAVHAAAGAGRANVVVERRFEEPVMLESVQAIEDAAAWCLREHQVTFLRTYFSADRRNMLCLYSAPDAESVRMAQHQAKMPVDRVWACRNFSMDDLTASS
jgi:hypothetical protein